MSRYGPLREIVAIEERWIESTRIPPPDTIYAPTLVIYERLSCGHDRRCRDHGWGGQDVGWVGDRRRCGECYRENM